MSTRRISNMDVSVIQEDFKWMRAGKETPAPRLTGITPLERRKYTREMKEYARERAAYFASLGKDDPRTITITSGLDATIRLTIISASEFGTAEPPISANVAPTDSSDFDRPQGRAPSTRHAALTRWIAMEDEFNLVEERQIPIRDTMNGITKPKFETLGVQAALADVFKRIEDRLTDVFPAALENTGPATKEWFKVQNVNEEESGFLQASADRRETAAEGRERMVRRGRDEGTHHPIKREKLQRSKAINLETDNGIDKRPLPHTSHPSASSHTARHSVIIRSDTHGGEKYSHLNPNRFLRLDCCCWYLYTGDDR